MAFHFNKIQRNIGLFPTSKKCLFNHFNSKSSGTSGLNENESTSTSSNPSAPCINHVMSLISSKKFFSCPGLCLQLRANGKTDNELLSLMATSSVSPSMSYGTKAHVNFQSQSHNREEVCYAGAGHTSLTASVKPEPRTERLPVCERIPVNVISKSPSECVLDTLSASDLRHPNDATSASSLSCSVKSKLDTSDLLFFSTTKKRNNDDSMSDGKKGPTLEQLEDATEKVTIMVKELFKGNIVSSTLHANLVFENNLQGTNKVTTGVQWYAWEIAKIRAKVHIQNAQASVDVMNISVSEVTGIIRVHWRLTGVNNFETFKFWKRAKDKGDESIEAFSYFHIGKDGLVHKIRIDRSLPDDSAETAKDLKAKLTRMLNTSKPNPLMCV